MGSADVESKLCALVGLAMRARRLALGRAACRDAGAAGRLHLILLARDAGSSTLRDSRAGDAIPSLQLDLDKHELGGWVGRDSVAILGVVDPHLAAGLLSAAQAPAAKSRPLGGARRVAERPGGGE